MRRREFIAVATAWPLAARAQQGALPVIGLPASGSRTRAHAFVHGTSCPSLLRRTSETSPGSFASRVRAFHKGLSETGYVEGRNVAIEYRWAEDRYDRLPALVTDLVRRQVAVIVATAGPAAVAAKAATTTIPIIFTGGFDPLQIGLVASLNRPGGNLTGVVTLNAELIPKRLELLHEAVPTATIVGMTINRGIPSAENQQERARAAARTLGLQIHFLAVSTERDFETAFATLGQLGIGGLVIGTDPLSVALSAKLAALALRNAVPAIFHYHEFAAAGGLISYGTSDADTHRLVGVYASRILEGGKVADLPVYQATKVELVINMKTAKALGLTIPLALLGRADEVIE